MDLGGLQDSVSQVELGIADKFHKMEDTLNKLTEALLSNKEGLSSNTNNHNAQFSPQPREIHRENG